MNIMPNQRAVKIKRLCCIIFIALNTLSVSHTALAHTVNSFSAQVDPMGQCGRGALLFLQGKVNEARPLLEAGFQAMQKSPPTQAGGICATYLAILYHSGGAWGEALTVYQKLGEIARAVGDQQQEWAALFGAGTVYLLQGRYADAEASLNKASALVENSTRPWSPANLKELAKVATLNNLGLTVTASYRYGTSARQYERPRKLFQEAFAILQRIGASTATENNGQLTERFVDLIAEQLKLTDADKIMLRGFFQILGVTDESLTENDRAVLQQVLPLLTGMAAGKTEKDINKVMDALLSGLVGGVISSLARDFAPTVLNNIGETYRYDKDYIHAEQTFTQALAMVEQLKTKTDGTNLPNPLLALMNEGNLYNNLGLVYWEKGEKTKALANLEHALTILQDKVANLTAAATIHINIGYLKQEAGQRAEALRHYEQAMTQVEAVRSTGEGGVLRMRVGGDPQTTGNVGNLEQIALQGMLTQYADVYAYAANLYEQLGNTEAAFHTAERGRARLFLDLMATGSVDLPEKDAQMLAAVQNSFDARLIAQVALTQTLAVEPKLPDRTLVAYWQQEWQAAQKAYTTQFTALQAYNPQLAALAPGSDLIMDTQQLAKQWLDGQTTLIEYYLNLEPLKAANDWALAWVVDEHGIQKTVRLDLTGPQVRAQVLQLSNNMNRLKDTKDTKERAEIQAEIDQSLAKLYEALFAPLKPYVQHKNLFIIPHSELHYLPFAALWDAKSKRYLVQDYTITYLPSASALPFIQHNRNPNQGRLLALGDPDGSLTNAITEVNTIAGLYATQPLTGALATESLVYSQSQKIDILHLAAHGTYNPFDPLATGIQLAPDAHNDGTLQVSEVFKLQMKETNVVVLSACKTAIGAANNAEQTVSYGDEIVGLTRAFLYAGTPSIVTTLWSIEDAASSQLMIAFHRYLRQGKPAAEALRQAQVDVLSQSQWRSPYYWAAFTLHGDAVGSGEPKTLPPNLFQATPPTMTVTVTAQSTTTNTLRLEVTTAQINVRSGPGANFAPLGEIHAGDQVQVVGQSGDGMWWQVCCVDGQQGWVVNNKNDVHVLGDAATKAVP